MEDPNASAQAAQPSQDDQHGTKRQLDEQINPDTGAKRARTDAQNDTVQDGPSSAHGSTNADSTNGVSEIVKEVVESKDEPQAVEEVQPKTIVEAPVAETRGLPKGTAPIKQE